MDTIEKWHNFVANPSTKKLDNLLAKEVVFYSPIVYSEQVGLKKTKAYLMAASRCLFNESFGYSNQIITKETACLEFNVTIKNVDINGVDLISWNSNGAITKFKVMLRPLRSIKLVHQLMADELT